MDIRNLRTFAAVADLGSISSASKMLRCVQSNVTTRVKALEAELGVDLFYRSRSGMTLTSAGITFLPYAKDVIHAAERARSSLDSFSDTPTLLRLGSMETTLAIRLPEILSVFRNAYPGVRLQIFSGPTDDLVAKVLENRLDIALVGGQFPHPQLNGHSLFTEEMVLITSKSQRNISDIRSSIVIVFKQGCSYRDYTRRWMRRAGLAPNETFELGTLDGILGCVVSGVGVTCLPRSIVEASHFRSSLHIHSIEDPERFIDTYAIESKTAVKNAAVTAFIATARAAE